jgi:hypothetical protein
MLDSIAKTAPCVHPERRVCRERHTSKAVHVLQSKRTGTLSHKGSPSFPATVRLCHNIEDATDRVFELCSCKAEGRGALILHCQA